MRPVADGVLKKLQGHARRAQFELGRHVTLNHLFVAVGLLGFWARVAVARGSVGSNDMRTWTEFARLINTHGLGHVYDTEEGFNHPPLMGLMAAALAKASVATGIRPDLLFKAPSLVADALSAGLVYAAWRRHSVRLGVIAFALFCWSPPSILVTAYHGNTDSICAAFALLAAVLVDSERPMSGGLALGASVNVKLIPVILIPLLLSSAGAPKKALRFLAGLSAGAIPFLPVLLWHWKGYYQHALVYRSNFGHWGITGILTQLTAVPRIVDVANPLDAYWVRTGARYIVLVSCVFAVINLVTRRWSAKELTACGFGSFLALTPGWGVQYLAYLTPALFAVNIGYGVAYSVVAGAYAFLLYFANWTGERPLLSVFPANDPVGVQSVGYCAWVVVIFAVIHLAKNARGSRGVRSDDRAP
jgi:hypothetical protein